MGACVVEPNLSFFVAQFLNQNGVRYLTRPLYPRVCAVGSLVSVSALYWTYSFIASYFDHSHFEQNKP
jgi:hypothetical protein